MNGIRLHGIVSNGLHRWAHVLAHALGQSSILPWSMSMWPAILDFHENFRSADRHGGQDRSNLCLSPYESATEQAPCAKPPFCDAIGGEADYYDDEGDARKRCWTRTRVLQFAGSCASERRRL